MKLIGNFISPYARRVAITLNLLELPYEMQTIMISKQPEVVAPHNPLVRIPTLLLDDGTALIESGAILDNIDHLVGADRALVPMMGAARQEQLQLIALATGIIDKTLFAFGETRNKPQADWDLKKLDHSESRMLSGFAALEAKTPGSWFAGEAIGQSDITIACAYGFALLARPLGLDDKFPKLTAHRVRCESLDAFKRAAVPI